jgi:hypothetical protein
MLRLRAIAVAFGSVLLCSVSDAVVSVGPSTVLGQSTNSYQTYGNGDVVFQLTQNSLSQSGCYGFWLRASDAGFKNNFAILLSVILTQGQITVTADDSASGTWSGSANKYCLVTSLQL